jgi:hypothetical protein
MKRVERKFGDTLNMAAISIKGELTQERCDALVEGIIAAVGLQCIPGRILYKYPYDGGGGNGFTMIQPITESFVAIDQWEDHNGGYLILCSCKNFDMEIIESLIRGFELKILSKKYITLSLRDGKN